MSADADAKKKTGNNKYRKDKPWDHEGVDHWKIEPWGEDEGKMLLDESSFATLFPKYREQYLREVWSLVVETLSGVGIGAELDAIEGSMTVFTTRKTRDPFAIIKARDMIKLLARSVPLEHARRILDDDVACDVIKIGNRVRNKERFIKRRKRLVGPQGQTLKALEILTECYILVQGNTVSAIGPYKGLKILRRIVDDCFNNIHPVYNIKKLMIKRELASDPALAEESWDRFLPQFKKKNVKRRKPHKVRTTDPTDYSPFPPAQLPRKVDLQLESGEYHLSADERRRKEKNEAFIKTKEHEKARRNKRNAPFVAPPEAARPAAAIATGTDSRSAAEVADAIRRKRARPASASHDEPPAKKAKSKDKSKSKSSKSKSKSSKDKSKSSKDKSKAKSKSKKSKD